MQLPSFNTINLKNIEQVKLMNRIDTKYWFHTDKLSEILEEAKAFYNILEIEGKTILSYSSTYFDTEFDSMYTAHHNGKLNRFKVRQRTYLDSGISFLEIKRKSNKGRTIKSRIATENHTFQFNDEEALFLSDNCPFTSEHLKPAISNTFKRITLVGKELDERCTIDFNLSFSTNGQRKELNNLSIIEIKTDGLPSQSKLAGILLNRGIKKSGFSKYCIGRALLGGALKTNAFKPRLRQMKKTLFAYN